MIKCTKFCVQQRGGGKVFATKQSNNGNWRINFRAGKHFAVDEIGNCGELCVIGKTLKQGVIFIIRDCGEYSKAVRVI